MTATLDYKAFIESKSQKADNYGFDPIWIPDLLFDFQKSLCEWAIRKGRAAIFADCGLGKTLIQLVWAENVCRKTGGRMLIITPLAVGAQTIREAEKFGMEAEKCKDGTSKARITVTNYERLHYYKAEDFIGCVCDECFAAGTSIDTPSGRKYIEDIRKGDAILNCSGVDHVSDIHKREVTYAALVKIGNSSILASPNHPFFTQRGWVGAQHLRASDYTLATGAAMSLVREGVCAEIPGAIRAEVLRDILLSEMADASAGNSDKGSLPGGGGEAWPEESSMAGERMSEGDERTSEDNGVEPDIRPGGMQEDIHPIESHEAQTFRAWGQWARDDIRSGRDDGCSWRRLDSGIQFVTGPTASRLSNGLQDRLRESAEENRRRGGWKLAPSEQPQGRGREEGSDATFVRVDSVEILERGNHRLEQFREADGKLYFYDLGAIRHPSYSVNGTLVHNSSILKNFDGKYKSDITKFMRKMSYRLLCTATAAPNDYIELGTSSEALGEMGFMDMLGRFFKNDTNPTVDTRRRYASHGGEVPKWRFKRHAEMPFWRWVCSWARAVRRPSDIGCDDGKMILPQLIEQDHVIKVSRPAEGKLFVLPAACLKEQREERRATIYERCELAADLASKRTASICWCHLNDEGDLIEKLLPGCVQVCGSQTDEEKEEKLAAFLSGEAKWLVTKPMCAGFGLNLQHCSHMTFFPSHSYEQYYQSVRRCWRFGQKKPVTVDIVTSEGESQGMQNLQRKSAASDAMFSKLVACMNDALSIKRANDYTRQEEIPSWLAKTN